MLSGKGITGSIPFELTKLPALVELYVMIIPFFFSFFSSFSCLYEFKFA
jgi:hypothetical protein